MNQISFFLKQARSILQKIHFAPVALAVGLALGQVSAQASALTTKTGDKKMEGHSLITTAELNLDGSKIELGAVGAGIRTKKVVFINVQIYLGQLLASEASSYDKSVLLKSASSQKAVAMHLTFLRSVDVKKILTSFEDSFKANAIDATDPEIAQLLSAVRASGDIGKGQSIQLIGFHRADKDVIWFEDTKEKKTEVIGASGLIQKVFSLFLGKPGDSGVASFQQELAK